MNAKNIKSSLFNEPSQIKNLLKSHNLILMRNLKNLTEEDLLTFAQQLSNKRGDIKRKLLHWENGPIMKMSYQNQAKNYLYSQEKVPFHWDGAFYKEPRFLLFYCTESEGKGGETLFSDTSELFNSLNLATKRKMKNISLQYETEKVVHYGGKIEVPLLQTHPKRKNKILRFAERVESTLNPVELKIKSNLNQKSFYQWMVNKIYDSRFCYEHQWKKGDLIIADNFSLIHGRNALGDNLKRSFLRVQVL